MILNPIILALVFAFLARGAGGEDVNTNNGTKSSQNGTSTTNVDKGQVVNVSERDCAKMFQECSSIYPNLLNGKRVMETDGSEGSLIEAQPTRTNTMMTENFTRRSSLPVQTDASGTMRSNNDPICNCNPSCHLYNPGNLAPWIASTIVLTVALVGLVVYHCCTVIRRPRWNQDPNNDVVVANSDVAFHSFAMQPASTNISQMQLNEGITLEQLEHENLVEFEWICMRLDNGQRRDYERLAAKYPRISLDQRQSLQHEFQNRGGSPSKALMKHLQVLYPYLTLGDLLRSLAEIGRVDIVQRLKQNVKKDTCGTVA